MQVECESGGIGRRAGLRIPCPRRRGSNPLSRTISHFPPRVLSLIIEIMILRSEAFQTMGKERPL